MTLSLITINGTGSYPTDPTNFPSMVALALLPSGEQIFADKLDGLQTTPIINWLPLTYPMLTYPMGASVDTGVANLIALIKATPGKIGVLAYSQGALVWATVWRDHILNPDGELHDRLGDIVLTICWGNPMRAPGKQNGNVNAGWALNPGGGISGTDDLLPSQVPDWWWDFTDPNDLYTDSPGISVSADGKTILLTPTSEDEMLIYRLIVTTNFGGTLEGLLGLVEQAVEQLKQPLEEVIGIATAIWNGLTFAAAGPNAGHYTYNVQPAIVYVQQVALQYL
jgi:hypothetical protein